MPLNAGRKKSKAKVRKPAKTEIRYKEIDNYDFLYDGTDFDEEYNVSAVNDLMDEAFSHVGARYRSGSKGPSAFDCSGFTSYVFKRFGIELDRSSRGQIFDGVRVKKNDLQPGDLVFFQGRSGRGGVGHVGIVTKVNEDNTFHFIHSACSSGVTESKNTESYYSRRYVGACRVL
jgi:cell wall-associated NlpC family hydrolase